MKNSRYVTKLQYEILQVCKEEYLTPKQISIILDKKPNIIAFTIKHLLKLDYIKKSKYGFMALDIQYIACESSKVAIMRRNQQLSEMVDMQDELKAYIPTPDEQNRVITLHNAGLKRKEIAKLLNMKPTDVLWTLIFMKDDSKTVDKNDSIFVPEFDLIIYQNMDKKDFTIEKMCKLLKCDYYDVVYAFMRLEEKGAVIIKVHRTHTEYIKIEHDLKKQEDKISEPESKKVKCKCSNSCENNSR